MKKRPHRISPKEMKKLIELLDKHRSIKKVVEISGRSNRWLIKIAQKNHIKMKSLKMTPEEKEKIIALLKEKRNASAVARIVGRSGTTTLQVAANHGIRLKQIHKSSKK